DRKALPAPEGLRAVESEYAAPADAVEERLAAIWGEVLRVERVGAHNDFFALGGHSLLATQVASRLREAFGLEIPLRGLFEATTGFRSPSRSSACGFSTSSSRTARPTTCRCRCACAASCPPPGWRGSPPSWWAATRPCAPRFSNPTGSRCRSSMPCRSPLRRW